MKQTVAIKNYDLTIPLGLNAKSINIVIFTKPNSHNVKAVHAKFSADRNERSVIQILEETQTKIKNIRLLLGEKDRSKFIEFLRKESNQHFIFNFDSVNGSSFRSGKDIETNIEGDSFTVFQLDSFALHSQAIGRKKPVISRVVDTVLGR